MQTYGEVKAESHAFLPSAINGSESSPSLLGLLNSTEIITFSNTQSGEWSPNWVHSASRPLLAYCICTR
jgi:hypothetical protein